MSPSEPVLWHIPVSHYNEKARWALDFKGVGHRRRAPLPPTHMPVALWLTRGGGNTFPLLELDGRSFGDSTAIIAELERRWPQPRLYPRDDAERRRALALEEHFDEELGPYTRLLAFHELLGDPEAITDFAAGMLPAPLSGYAAVRALAGKGAAAFAEVRYRARSEDLAADARRRIVAGFDRLEAELEGGEGRYLVGDEFSVADLSAAALLIPVVQPPQGPELPPPPAALREFSESLSARAGFGWVEEIFSRHRRDARRP